MWEYRKEDLNEEVAGNNYMSISGCYNANIKKIELSKTSGGADQVVFDFETIDGEVKVYFAFTKKTGEELAFKTKHLNHLLYLCKLTDPRDIKKCEGKSVGVFLKAKLSYKKDFINFDLEGFYHPTQEKTARELAGNLPKEEVQKMKDKYSKEVPLERIKNETTNTTESIKETLDDDDSFPF